MYEFAEHFYCSYLEWNDKIDGDKLIVSKELNISIELNDFKEFIVFEETFNPLLTKYKNKYCADDLKPSNTTLQAMIEFHQSQR